MLWQWELRKKWRKHMFPHYCWCQSALLWTRRLGPSPGATLLGLSPGEVGAGTTPPWVSVLHPASYPPLPGCSESPPLTWDSLSRPLGTPIQFQLSASHPCAASAQTQPVSRFTRKKTQYRIYPPSTFLSSLCVTGQKIYVASVS